MTSNGSFAVQGIANIHGISQWLISVRRTIEIGIAFPISVLGILGNLFAFIVLCWHKQRSTTSVLLQGLAIIDSLILACTILLRSLRYSIPGFDRGEGYIYMFRWLYPSIHILRLISTWMTVLLTVDRFIAVRHPLHAQRLCTLRRTYVLMVLISLIAIVISTPRFCEFEAIRVGDSVLMKSTAFHKDEIYTLGYRIVFFMIIMYLIPMVLMIILNTLLLITLHKANSHRNALQGSLTANILLQEHSPKRSPHLRENHDGNSFIHTELSSGSHQRRGSMNMSVTVIVITIVVVSITCNSMAMTAHIFWSLTTTFPHLAHLDPARRVLSNISNLLVTINSAINFVIYCLCSHNFRCMCVRTFKHCQCLCKWQRYRSQYHGSSAVTSNISLQHLSNNGLRQNIGQISLQVPINCN